MFCLAVGWQLYSDTEVTGKATYTEVKMLEKENELLLNKETIDSLKKQILENQERIKQLYVERDASYLSEVSDIH